MRENDQTIRPDHQVDNSEQGALALKRVEQSGVRTRYEVKIRTITHRFSSNCEEEGGQEETKDDKSSP